MMKKLVLLITAMLFVGAFSVEVKAQHVNDEIYTKENVPQRRPVVYPYTRESDVMWSKKIWRVIDLREKMNHPLYYPTQPMNDRMSLFDLIMWGIDNEGLTAYEDDEFKVPMTRDQIYEKLDALPDTTWVDDFETGDRVQKIIEGEVRSEEIKQFMVKEQWFFDKQYSTMQVRIIGICPIRVYSKNDEEGNDQVRRERSFWVYFQEARPILANHEVFNLRNDSQRISFDDLFHKRMFGSFIFQESNVYNNRAIREYTVGVQTLLEAERVKNELFDLEHDLWEY